MNMSNDERIEKEAREYCDKMEKLFKRYSSEWESFASEVSPKFSSLVRSGIGYSMSNSSSSSGSERSIGVGLSFTSNTDAAKEYLESVPRTMESKVDLFIKAIREMDKKIGEFQKSGLVGKEFSQLVKLLGKWISYMKTMKVDIMGRATLEAEIPSDFNGLKPKWEKVEKEEVRKAEAAKYGVSLSNLDKHISYLDAKKQKLAAKTSSDMKKVEKIFYSMNGYLDSAELSKECASIGAEMKQKEEERRKEEAERLRIAVEKYEKECADVDRKRAEFISDETKRLESQYKKTASEIEHKYKSDLEKLENEIASNNAQMGSFEKELSETSLFAFAKKKQLRLDLETIGEKIRKLEKEKSSLISAYKSKVSDEKSKLESALKVLPMNAGKKFVMPKDPRK